MTDFQIEEMERGVLAAVISELCAECVRVGLRFTFDPEFSGVLIQGKGLRFVGDLHVRGLTGLIKKVSKMGGDDE